MYRMFRIQSIKKKYDSRLDLHRYQWVGLHWIVVGGFIYACAGTNDEHTNPYMQTLSLTACGTRREVPYYYYYYGTRGHFKTFLLLSSRSEMSLLK